MKQEKLLEFEKFIPLHSKIDKLLLIKPNPIIAIEGNAAAGKSALAEHIAKVFDCNAIHMDDFFLPANKRTAERIGEVGGNVDYERFAEEVISKVLSDKVFEYRIFDCSIMDFSGSVKVNPLKMTVIEGAYSMHPAFGDIYDLKVFLTVDDETQKARILKRNGAEMLEKFISLWIPKENEYFREMHVPERCDLIF